MIVEEEELILPIIENVGFSKYEADRIDVAKELMEKAESYNVNMILPVDVLAGKEFAPKTKCKSFKLTVFLLQRCASVDTVCHKSV